MQDEYKSALDGNIDLDRKIVKLGELNEHFPSIPVTQWKSQHMGKISWDRLVSKYAPHTASSLLKLKSKLKDPDEWISNLIGLQIYTNEFGQKGNVMNSL